MSDTGAVPLVKLAELDSAQHHLREQTDRDRRSQASRNRDFNEMIVRIDLATKENAKAVAVVDRAVGQIQASMTTVKWLVGVAVGLIPMAVGAAWALGRLIH